MPSTMCCTGKSVEDWDGCEFLSLKLWCERDKECFLRSKPQEQWTFLGKHLTFLYARKVSWNRLFKLDFKWIMNGKDKDSNIRKENSRKPGRPPTNLPLPSVSTDPEHQLQLSLTASHSPRGPHRPFYLPTHPLFLLVALYQTPIPASTLC